MWLVFAMVAMLFPSQKRLASMLPTEAAAIFIDAIESLDLRSIVSLIAQSRETAGESALADGTRGQVRIVAAHRQDCLPPSRSPALAAICSGTRLDAGRRNSAN